LRTSSEWFTFFEKSAFVAHQTEVKVPPGNPDRQRINGPLELERPSRRADNPLGVVYRKPASDGRVARAFSPFLNESQAGRAVLVNLDHPDDHVFGE